MHDMARSSDSTYRSDDQQVVTDQEFAFGMDSVGDTPYQNCCAEDANAQSCTQDLRSTVGQGPYL